MYSLAKPTLKLIICLDSRGGWVFNNRRLSRDQEVNKRIMEIAGNNPIWGSQNTIDMLWSDIYRCDLYQQSHDLRVITSQLPAMGAETTNYIFAESLAVLNVLPYYDEIIVFHWNRAYPFDTRFPINFHTNEKWQLRDTATFAGTSHQEILEEHYTPTQARRN